MAQFMNIEEPARSAPPVPAFALWQLGFRPFYLLASVVRGAVDRALGAAVFGPARPRPISPGRCGMRTRCCSASRSRWSSASC